MVFVCASDSRFVEVAFVPRGNFSAGVDALVVDPVGGVGFTVWGGFG